MCRGGPPGGDEVGLGWGVHRVRKVNSMTEFELNIFEMKFYLS